MWRNFVRRECSKILTNMADCIFCKIIKGELPSQTVFEDDRVAAIKDIHPKAPIHFLIITKDHIESVAHLGAGDSDAVSRLVYAAKKVAEDLSLKGYKLVFNVGREGGQEIDHLHLHLLGGWTPHITSAAEFL